MDTERDVTRIVQSWLRTDEHESADRVLDDVLALLDATPQRRSWWPVHRSAHMNTFTKLVLAAAAVVVVAVIAINLPRANGGVGGTGTTAAPSPTQSHSPTPMPSPSQQPGPSDPSALFPARGELAVARHSVTVSGIPLSFSVPTPGWFSTGEATSGGGYIMKGTPGTKPAGQPKPAYGWVLLWSPDGVYTDPCTQKKGPAVGPSAADLAAALKTIAGTEVIAPDKGTVGGRDAKRVLVSIPKDAPCAAEQFHLWYDNEIGGRWASLLPTTIRVWVVDVDGTPLFFETEVLDWADPGIDEEMQQIVNSIQFE
jgi:hypothetical protein